MSPLRLFVLWCPDWPVVAAAAAAGLPPHEPAAVVAANRVVACSGTARAEGIRRGLRRREVQARCPELVVFDDNPARDARHFEPVAAAVEELAPGVELVRPGIVAVPARGPARYFGGEEAAAEKLVDVVAGRTGLECQIGVADGLFAATLAAHRGVLVPPGASAEFLAPLDIEELRRPTERAPKGHDELVDLLRRLGIRTLGGFAELPARDVSSRFGTAAEQAHRLCRGLDERPPSRRRPPPDLAVTQHFDPPVERVDAAAFAARALADRLHTKLIAHGWACSRLLILAHTENGDEFSRTWRCAEPLTPGGTADRVRWQLDGWLSGTNLGGTNSGGGRNGARPSTGVDMLRIEPDEVIAADALQLDLLGGDAHTAAQADRAGRAMVHVQGLLGPDAVLIGVLGGGRGPADQVRLVPWGDEPAPALPGKPPWPGRLPSPSPSAVPPNPLPATVFAADGAPVAVTDRFLVTAPPHRVAVNGGDARTVLGWAGPWPVTERWWADLLRTGGLGTSPSVDVAARSDGAPRGTASPRTDTAGHTGGAAPAAGRPTGVVSAEMAGIPGVRPMARFQVVLDAVSESGESALLLLVDGDTWYVEGVYA